MPPLSGLRVILRARGVAAAYAGRLLGTMGAEVVLLEPPQGSPLRGEPPFLAPGVSALFAYLAAGMSSRVCDDPAATGALLSEADVLIDDTPLAERDALGLDEASIARRHPDLVHVSVLPFGAHGPKAVWKAEEINIQHASGEGNLLPNGLLGLAITGLLAAFMAGMAANVSAFNTVFSYDLWGDAVNTAARMESHGEPGKIHVSEEFKHAVETHNIASLQFIERGEIDIKGKGKMKTYFLEKPR